jgi:hypothetical protein
MIAFKNVEEPGDGYCSARFAEVVDAMGSQEAVV